MNRARATLDEVANTAVVLRLKQKREKCVNAYFYDLLLIYLFKTTIFVPFLIVRL